MRRLKEIDCLRGIACLLVLLFHYTTKYSEIFNSDLTTAIFSFKYGGLGVDLFFVISGFVILLSASRNISSTKFAYGRFSRLYPTFWICALITFFIIRGSDLVQYHRSFSDLLVNLTMVPDIFGVTRIDGVYWSLLPELMFYGLILGLLIIKKLKIIELVCIVWLSLILINSFHDSPPLRVLLNLRFGHLFIIGICFYKIKMKESSWLHHTLIILAFSVSFVIGGSIEKQVALLLFIGIFYLVAYDKLKWFKFAPLVKLGEISYALYLIHQFIGYLIINRLINAGVDNSILLLVIPTITTIGIAYLISMYVEKPIQFVLKKGWDRFHERTP